MIRLLDVNVLVALFDANHPHHNLAHVWFEPVAKTGWATCPTTENGLVRVLGNPSYPNLVTSTWAVASRLTQLCENHAATHHFWLDPPSLRDTNVFDHTTLVGHRQLADISLLALAVRYKAALATFDSRIPLAPVLGASDGNLEQIPLSEP